MKIKDCWKWAAMDADGEWFLYMERPHQEDESIWKTKSGRDCQSVISFLTDLPKISDWKESLHQIIDGELVKHIDLKVDDKVMVANRKDVIWYRRRFYRFEPSGNISCFPDGQDSWTATRIGRWVFLQEFEKWRLPTEEESK